MILKVIIALIVLGLLLYALNDLRKGGGIPDSLTQGLTKAIKKAQQALISKDCDRLKEAVQELDKAIAKIPTNLNKYKAIIEKANQAKKQCERIIEEDCE